MGGHFFRQQTTLLRMCEGLGISTKFFVFFCVKENCTSDGAGKEVRLQNRDMTLS
jgi:hypothetical protein